MDLNSKINLAYPEFDGRLEFSLELDPGDKFLMALTVSMYFLCSRSSNSRLSMISRSCLSITSLWDGSLDKLRWFLTVSSDVVSTIGGGIGGGFSLGGFLFEPGSNSFGGRFCKEKGKILWNAFTLKS